MTGRMTHTYALLPVSEACFNEISEKLMAAGYEHCVIMAKENAIHLDLTGLALVSEGPSAETIRQGVE